MWRRIPRIFVPSSQHDRENLTVVLWITTKNALSFTEQGFALPDKREVLADKSLPLLSGWRFFHGQPKSPSMSAMREPEEVMPWHANFSGLPARAVA